MKTKSKMWEILIPTHNNSGEEFDVSTHEFWDSMVRKKTGGLTINKSAKGQWVSPANKLHVEKVIPVRIACSEIVMGEIAQTTKEYYSQEQTLYYKISDEVYFV